MLILLMLSLAASDGAPNLEPHPLQVQAATQTPGQTAWFQPGTKSFGSSAPIEHVERPLDPAPVGTSAEMNCTLRILKADPKLDAKIARPGPPDLDPKIVRPSPCRK